MQNVMATANVAKQQGIAVAVHASLCDSAAPVRPVYDTRGLFLSLLPLLLPALSLSPLDLLPGHGKKLHLYVPLHLTSPRCSLQVIILLAKGGLRQLHIMPYQTMEWLPDNILEKALSHISTVVLASIPKL